MYTGNQNIVSKIIGVVYKTQYDKMHYWYAPALPQNM